MVADLLRFYLSYYPLQNTNRKFVVFFRNESGWPQAAFYDVEEYVQQDVAQKQSNPKYYTDILPCRVVAGAAVPL